MCVTALAFITLQYPGVLLGLIALFVGADPGVGEDKATDDYMAALDVVGYNYSPQRYKQDHARLPDRVIVATETFPVRC